MTTQRDLERALDAFFAEGADEMADRVIDDALRIIDHTHQRSVLGVPWRSRTMNPLARLAAATAAIVIVAGAALYVLSPGSQSVGGPQVTPSPTPSASPLVYKWMGLLAPGTYATSLSWDPSLVFTFTLGEGWESRDINVRQGGHVSVAFYPIENIATEPCSRTLGDPPQTTDDVVRAIEMVATIDAPARSTRIGDRDASYLQFTIDPPEACSAMALGLIKLPAQTCTPGICNGLGGDWYGLEFGAVTHHHGLSVMDVGRRLVAIDAVWTEDATAEERAALQAVVDSVRLGTPLATPPPSPGG
jgi:hypothetical protein